MFKKFINVFNALLGLGDDVVSVITGTPGVPGPAGSLSSDQQTYL